MTIQERIADIAKRYGEGSWQELQAKDLAECFITDKEQ